MTSNNLNEIALQAWKDAMGDAATAVKLLRDRAGLSLHEAAKQIQKTAHQVGGRFTLRLVGEDAVALLALAAAQADQETKHSTRLAEHRAARGVRKVRGQKNRRQHSVKK
jgi:hypothetical protein